MLFALTHKAAAFFHPHSLPWITRQPYVRELRAALSAPVAIAMLEAGVVGVISKTIFDVSNAGFATIFAAPMFANLTSLFWARWSRGKHKAHFAAGILAAFLFVLILIALLPTTGWGPAALVALVVVGRCLMAGLITVRSTIWRANYPRTARGAVTSRFITIATLIMATVPLVVGKLLDWHEPLFRVLYPTAAGVGLIGVFAFLGIRIRHDRATRREELEHHDENGDARPSAVTVLKQDQHFRSYMLWQFFAGTGNMMGTTAFVFFMIETLKGHPRENFLSMSLTATVPMFFMMAVIPFWSRYLDRTHIARFRVFHGLTWLAAQSLNYVAAVSGLVALFFLPRIAQGIMFGGGALAWNLGHNDFADRRLAGLYMGIHQVLTGIRGAFAPFMGTFLFVGWSDIHVPGTGLVLPGWDGIGPYVFFVSFTLCVIAWFGFLRLSKQMDAQGLNQASDG